MSDVTITMSVGRKRKWVENAVARFGEGTFARISAVIGKYEDRTDFIREAVERELQRREAEAKKKPRRS